ncbi:hypothetical protein [Virgibacillus salexigens]|uniref:hypothetical protein n=1 Tax=Virgibacillus salexigens TaxID=61016 RepID=UPI00190C00AF|nr:hypothetical protein [Virgibacillus salexigens]
MADRQINGERTKNKKICRWTFCIVLCMLLTGGAYTAVFAEQNITGMLTNWFQQKTDEAIDHIELEISAVQNEQTNRLNDALKEEVEEAESDLNETVRIEIKARTKELQRYTDTLINKIEKQNNQDGTIDPAQLKELDQIVQEAKTKMQEVTE